MTIDAVLFDIDGTLIDSNYLHVEAWSRAFFEMGIEVDASKIHRGIGMDSDKLLEELIGERAHDVGDLGKSLHTSFYQGLQPRLRTFAGARELIAELDARGATIVLATSAPEAELQKLRAVLDIDDHLAIVTSADDVESAKPAPDIVSIALERSGTAKSQAVMVGDSVWDIHSARAAGVAAIGLLSGGTSRAELEEAGAIAVYADVSELLEKLDESPLASEKPAQQPG
jgi:HAD superfamily hydrolase (TIGR01509 family)